MTATLVPAASTILDELLEPWHRPDRPGWAVAIVRDGHLEAMACRGMASIEHAVPIDGTTVFSIASLSKQFACASILLLESRGVLRLDDPVRQHLPELTWVRADVTLRHLMTNTSGLRDLEALLDLSGYDFDRPLGHTEVMALLARQRAPVCPPGEEYLYCNTGFRLLAVVVERLTGSTWDTFVAQEILRPLGMERSRVCTDADAVVPGLATPYRRGADGTYRRTRGLAPVYAVAEGGESGMLSCLEDMARWAAAFRTGPLSDLLGRLTETPMLDAGARSRYGNGLATGDWRGQRIARHSGGMPGYKSEILHLLDAGFSVVAIANHEDTSPTRMARRVASRLVFGDDDDAAALPSRLAGRYLDVDTGVVVDLGSDAEGAKASVFDWDLRLDRVAPDRLESYPWWLEVELSPAPTDALRASLGGRPLTLRRVETDARHDLDDLPGRYRTDELDGSIRIDASDGARHIWLEGIHGDHEMGELVAVAPEHAVVAVAGRPPAIGIRLERDPDGRVASIVVASGAIRGVVLRRSDP